jgi:DNA-binding transcriptional regulator YdaS (Cro superfamily)
MGGAALVSAGEQSMVYGLKTAIDAAGGLRPLARLLGITPQAIMQWDKVPAERMLEIERVTGIARERLRPDLYRLPRQYLEDATDEATVDAIERQKLAAHDPGEPPE